MTMKGVVDSFQFIGLIQYKYHNMTDGIVVLTNDE